MNPTFIRTLEWDLDTAPFELDAVAPLMAIENEIASDGVLFVNLYANSGSDLDAAVNELDQNAIVDDSGNQSFSGSISKVISSHRRV